MNAKKAFLQSLLFFLNSAIISFVLRIPFLGDPQAYWQAAIYTVILYTPTAVLLGGVAFFCCRLVGGKGALPGHVTIFSYIAGVSVLIFALFSLVAKGIIKVELPDQFALYEEYMRLFFANLGGLDDERFRTLAHSRELVFSMLVLGVGLLLIAAWFVWACGAFSDWNSITCPRTVTALMLFLIFGYGVDTALTLVHIGVGAALFF